MQNPALGQGGAFSVLSSYDFDRTPERLYKKRLTDGRQAGKQKTLTEGAPGFFVAVITTSIFFAFVER